MTDQHASFIRAIIAQPDRDLRRLEYADWLEEHAGERFGPPTFPIPLGSNGYAERAEFIRVQCELARMSPRPQCLKPQPPFGGAATASCWCRNCLAAQDWDGNEYALRRRERELWYQCGKAIIRSSGFGIEMGLISGLGRVGAIIGTWQVFPARGFIEQVTCTAADWLAHGDAICAATPIREVTVTQTLEAGWYGNAELMLRDRWPQVEKWNLPAVHTNEIGRYQPWRPATTASWLS